MRDTSGRRTQATRDAMTVEIGYALLSATLAAALTLGAVAGPTVLFTLPGWAETTLLIAAAVLVPVIFMLRVVGVLGRFREAVREDEEEGQPSQPGRTSPDS
ncbi:DUF6332 family protein [Streptomyces sp. E11-3]|uniref:DUF6332 family protein n=1 Tax=Streptomyces sp. E11-3 TaxID=3110112 RepID=UPI00397F7CB3